MYSIVIPYLSKSKYIDQCKHYLKQNSAMEFEIVEIVDETDVYYAFNKGVYHAKYDKVVLMSDDMIVSKNWDVHFVNNITRDTCVTGYVIEPGPGTMYRPNGQIVENIRYDCGSSIENFDYDKFQSYVDSRNDPDVIHGEKGWYQPFGVFKKSFVSYPNIIEFPNNPNDVVLIDIALPNLGYKFVRAKSYIYHYQCKSWSNADVH